MSSKNFHSIKVTHMSSKEKLELEFKRAVQKRLKELDQSIEESINKVLQSEL